jgi:hypothetical protein
MPTIKLAIRPEWRDLLPPLSDEERAALEKSILAEGCRDPIVVTGSIIVDGHNRYDICNAHGLTFKTVEFHGGPDFHYLPMREKDEAIKRWIINTQLARRNLTDEQRTLYLGMLYESAKFDPVDNLKKGAGGTCSGSLNNSGAEPQKTHLGANGPIAQNEHSGKFDSTAAQIAKEHGVSAVTVRRAGEFARGLDRIGKVSPEVREKILSGESKAIVSMGQVRGLAGASEDKVKEAVKAVIDNKPLEKPPTEKPRLNANGPIAQNEHSGKSEPTETSIAAAPSVGKPVLDRSFPAQADSGGDHFSEKFKSKIIGAPDILDCIKELIDSISFESLTVPMMYGYYEELLAVRDIVSEQIKDVGSWLKETSYAADIESPTAEPPAVERPDAINWYADDFLSGIADMTNEQAGAYAKLLSLEQSKGPLTKEQMLAITQDKFVHKKFQITDDGTYINPRMEKEVKIKLAEQKEEERRRRAHGAAQRDRANKRWNGKGKDGTDGTECRGNAAAMPVLKDLKDKTKQDKHKDVYPATLSQDNKGVNVLSLGVKDKNVGVTDGAGAGAREEDFDQSAEVEFDQTAVEELDQTVGMEVEAVAAKGAAKAKAKKIDFTPPLHLADMWDDFLTVRKVKGAPPTQRAFNSIIRDLEKLAPGDTEKQRAILEQSICEGYKGVWPLKIKDTNTKQTQGKPLTSGRTVYGFEDFSKYDNL